MSSSISWEDLRTFLAVLEAGSFSGAARKLGVSHPTVRARIEALEADLGTVLFVRSNSGLVPTDTARALQEPTSAMAAASYQVSRHASSSDTEISGLVRLSVSEMMGIETLPGMIRTLHETYPELRVELSLSNTNANLLAYEVDLAVRTAAPVQDALVARKIGAIDIGLFASADYAARRGLPQQIEHLQDHDLIGPDRNRQDWALAIALGLNETSRNFVLRSDSHPAQVAAARAGLGISACPVPVGERDPSLVRVLPDVTLHSMETWIVAHENMINVPRVRATYDHLVAAFRRYAGRSASADAPPRQKAV